MKDLSRRIAEGDVPVEWALSLMAGGCIGLLVAWHFLTRDDQPKRGRGPSAFGLVLVLLGTLAMAFFYFQFDVSMLTTSGMRVANFDLMNQRQGGILIGGILFLGGIIVMLLRPKSKDDSFEK